ncbi:MAG: serine--tRNA ligase [Candidatus Liptonbacteria bacterium]|nr:serine--tRNA ligase [Candidatus Liptonbacteria bacterium]
MIDIELIRNEPDRVRKGLKNKQADPALVDRFLALDGEWRESIKKLDELRHEQKKLGEERKLSEAKAVKSSIKELDERVSGLETKRQETLMLIPNPPDEFVPVGENEKENQVLREVGERRDLGFAPSSYVELSEKLGLVDTERAGKVSGARFGYLLSDMARLEFALVKLTMDFTGKRENLEAIINEKNLSLDPRPFVPVVPPVLIRPEAMRAMGYMERGGDEIYHLEKDNLYLVGTSEQSVGPMHMGEVFEEKDLPRRYIAFSTCFRREAGSYGKDTKGILRVHQFDKAEMFSLATPETSRDEHQLLLGIEEKLMQLLDIPYRVLNICTGDLGDPAAAKFDIEAWLPGQNDGKGEYRETHSTSNTTDFQARRLNVRYRSSGGGELRFVHMLNGTAFAIGRTLIAIMENYQTKNGTVAVPEVLWDYVGKKEIAPPA